MESKDRAIGGGGSTKVVKMSHNSIYVRHIYTHTHTLTHTNILTHTHANTHTETQIKCYGHPSKG